MKFSQLTVSDPLISPLLHPPLPLIKSWATYNYFYVFSYCSPFVNKPNLILILHKPNFEEFLESSIMFNVVKLMSEMPLT